MRAASCKVGKLEIKEDAGRFIQRETGMTIVRMWQFEVEDSRAVLPPLICQNKLGSGFNEACIQSNTTQKMLSIDLVTHMHLLVTTRVRVKSKLKDNRTESLQYTPSSYQSSFEMHHNESSSASSRVLFD